ncbi:BON domain-containing protein [Chitinophaga silvisoli]|uniref:BON domain-containing protein n=1 Tax=Chitinophaga silvisoli TaxID=2291814 RepID=A0A3E1NUC6_9BACT|nr:BON domain-containing protein [Chitinophaga silvisoli]RFM31542.1 BON domain-containing protein [Chitinophaga silvisoli]
MKSDYLVQQDVQEELLWEPSLNAVEIGVSVKNGIVTLSGTVDSLSKKLAAERAVKRVKDVKAVAMDVEVEYPSSNKKSDAAIAQAAVDVLSWSNLVPKDSIHVEVEDGYITLEGEVQWQYQRDAARDAIKDLQGLKGISNLVTVRPAASAFLIKDNIKKALQRMANIEADNITLLTENKTITLKGKVRSWREREEVEQVVWSTPGVSAVKDELEIDI